MRHCELEVGEKGRARRALRLGRTWCLLGTEGQYRGRLGFKAIEGKMAASYLLGSYQAFSYQTLGWSF